MVYLSLSFIHRIETSVSDKFSRKLIFLFIYLFLYNNVCIYDNFSLYFYLQYINNFYKNNYMYFICKRVRFQIKITNTFFFDPICLIILKININLTQTP
jgi:hypothetical protein